MQDRILLAVVGRPHGVRGLCHVQCFADNPADLPRYSPLTDDRGRTFRLRWHADGIAQLSKLVDGAAVKLADRAAAERLVNLKLYVERDRLPPPDDEEFYLADLVGLTAVTLGGETLGQVAAVHDHGAGTFLEIGPLLVPFTRVAVPAVDIAGGRLTVVLPAEILGESPAEVAA